MGVSEVFISWVKLLFNNATVAVNFNGCPSKSFKVEWGVRQGCPLALYIFLIVGEALTQLITKAVAEGRIKRITLPGMKNKKTSRNMRMIPRSW